MYSCMHVSLRPATWTSDSGWRRLSRTRRVSPSKRITPHASSSCCSKLPLGSRSHASLLFNAAAGTRCERNLSWSFVPRRRSMCAGPCCIVWKAWILLTWTCSNGPRSQSLYKVFVPKSAACVQTLAACQAATSGTESCACWTTTESLTEIARSHKLAVRAVGLVHQKRVGWQAGRRRIGEHPAAPQTEVPTAKNAASNPAREHRVVCPTACSRIRGRAELWIRPSPPAGSWQTAFTRQTRESRRWIV
mmetsp:Transcript_173777/g.556955  ORF Transcript_173777/g.556955 Transcript_173777/m.556955 type:complete len:248 (+) Transcript_173777:691-1434(+)